VCSVPLLCGFLLLQHLGYLHTAQVAAFTLPRSHHTQRCGRTVRRKPHPSPIPLSNLKTQLQIFSLKMYGKGAEIWPPKNIDRPIKLEDSFPIDGQIPGIMQESHDPYTTDGSVLDPAQARASITSISPQSSTTNSIQRKRKRERVWDILKRAARYERSAAINEASLSMDYLPESAAISFKERKRIDQSPGALALSLVAMKLVAGGDIFFALAISSYLAVLYQFSRSANPNSTSPRKQIQMPALPPQGHVPSILANPLGHTLTESHSYRTWLLSGAILGLVLPLVSIGYYLFMSQREAAMLCASPVFLICCQAWTESVLRRLTAPLPLRILIPLLYNTRRLQPLFAWAFAPQAPSIHLGYAGRTLAMLNLLYWSLNLFGFLIPVATLRYIRAHCFCVEASEVTLREGHEDGAGLLPQI
jgi:hypothetical protein